MRRWMLIAGWVVLMGGGGGGAVAGEPGDLQKQLDELKAKVDALEAKKPPAPAEAKGNFWTDNVKLFGDFRLRYDFIDQPGRATPVPDRDRVRFRARLGADVTVNEEISLRFRLATDESTKSDSGADPTSNNQTMTNDFSKKPVWWDLACADYHPKLIAGLHVIGGKMEVPFINVGRAELLWNNCLTPEGGAVKYAPKLGAFELLASAGAFWLQERAGSSTATSVDSGLFGAQAGLKCRLDDKGSAYLLAGGGYFDYVHAKGFATFDYTGGTKSFGNTLDAANSYRFDYNEAEVFAEVGFPVFALPVVVFGEWVKNTAVSEDAQAYVAGLAVGKLEKPWDWALRYDFRRVEKDSVLGAFNGTDAFGGGTDGQGHKFGADLQLAKGTWLTVNCFLDKANIARQDTTDPDADYHRLQVELNFKF